jgi:hypothetical protein
MAFAFTSYEDPELRKKVLDRFAKRAFVVPGESDRTLEPIKNRVTREALDELVLRFFIFLLAGKEDEAVSSVLLPSEKAKQPPSPAILSLWRKCFLLALLAPANLGEKSLNLLGERLRTYGRSEAALLCHIVSSSFKGSNLIQSLLALPNASVLRQFFPWNFCSFHYTEILEYILLTSRLHHALNFGSADNETLNIMRQQFLHFQGHKVLFARWLLSAGYVSDAKRYTLSLIRAHAKGYFEPLFGNCIHQAFQNEVSFLRECCNIKEGEKTFNFRKTDAAISILEGHAGQNRATAGAINNFNSPSLAAGSNHGTCTSGKANLDFISVPFSETSYGPRSSIAHTPNSTPSVLIATKGVLGQNAINSKLGTNLLEPHQITGKEDENCGVPSDVDSVQNNSHDFPTIASSSASQNIKERNDGLMDDLGFGNSSLKKRSNTPVFEKFDQEQSHTGDLKVDPSSKDNGMLGIVKLLFRRSGPTSVPSPALNSSTLNAPIKANLGEENSFYFDKDQNKWVSKNSKSIRHDEVTVTNISTPTPPKDLHQPNIQGSFSNLLSEPIRRPMSSLGIDRSRPPADNFAKLESPNAISAMYGAPDHSPVEPIGNVEFHPALLASPQRSASAAPSGKKDQNDRVRGLRGRSKYVDVLNHAPASLRQSPSALPQIIPTVSMQFTASISDKQENEDPATTH